MYNLLPLVSDFNILSRLDYDSINYIITSKIDASSPGYSYLELPTPNNVFISLIYIIYNTF